MPPFRASEAVPGEGTRVRSKAQSCLCETSPHAHLFRLPLGVALVVGMSLLACGGDSGGGAESPASLGIVAEPAGGFTGRALPVQPVVELRRPSGARATEASAEVVATITSGRGALSG